MEADARQREAPGQLEFEPSALLIGIGEPIRQLSIADGWDRDRERGRLWRDTERAEERHLRREGDTHRRAWARSNGGLRDTRVDVAAHRRREVPSRGWAIGGGSPHA